jgi:hypothetical protein
MKELASSKEYAAQGLSIYAAGGHSALLQALKEMAVPGDAHTLKAVGPFPACAMKMGEIKEPDVLLTYLDSFMGARKECIALKKQ